MGPMDTRDPHLEQIIRQLELECQRLRAEVEKLRVELDHWKDWREAHELE